MRALLRGGTAKVVGGRIAGMQLRGLCSPAAALRTLGLDRSTANPESLKAAFKAAALKWHPDRHQGASSAAAEERFKELQHAYQLLSAPGALHDARRGSNGADAEAGVHGAGPSTHSGRRRGAAWQDGRVRNDDKHWWGERFGPASRPGYNPHTAYMGFGGSRRATHFYEDTAAAAAEEDRNRMYRSWLGVGLFTAGLGLVWYTGARDRAAKERGDLVDAWW